jgi:ABC-2 type transport system permease protein
MNHLALLVRREFWEHRAFVFAPAVVAAFLVLIALTGGIFGQVHMGELPKGLMSHPDLMEKAPKVLAVALGTLTMPFLIVMCVVTVFYLLDSLYADRRDRTVLFWKSLPVSDQETVLSKLATAAVAMPVLIFVGALITAVLVALIASVRLSWEAGWQIWPLVWNPSVWFPAMALLLYMLVVGVLWYLPIFAWLLLVSASAGRAVMLWAALPPLGLMFLEKLVFGTAYFAKLLAYRLGGWTDLALNTSAKGDHAMIIDGERIPFSSHLAEVLDPATYFTSTGLWLGLIVAAGLVWATILIRRHRSEV